MGMKAAAGEAVEDIDTHEWFVTARTLRMYMSWYVALMQVKPEFTTNREIIEGRVTITVVPEDDPRLEGDGYDDGDSPCLTGDPWGEDDRGGD